MQLSLLLKLFLFLQTYRLIHFYFLWVLMALYSCPTAARCTLADTHRITGPPWSPLAGFDAEINSAFWKEGDAITIEHRFRYLYRIESRAIKTNMIILNVPTLPGPLLKRFSFTFCYLEHLQGIPENEHHHFLRNILVSDFFLIVW